jgi:hypothetical protein
MDTKNRLLLALISVPPEPDPAKRDAATESRFIAMMRALVSRPPANPNLCQTKP